MIEPIGTDRHLPACTDVRSSAFAATALVIAPAVAVDPGGWYPFGPAKVLAVSTVAAVLIGLTWWHPQARVPPTMAWSWAGVLTLVVLAAIAGVDGLYAWTGTPERFLGVVAWLLFAGCFAGGCQLADDASTSVVARGSVVAAVACGGWALTELVAGRPVDYASTSERLGGPFGSSAYLGAGACLLLPVAVGVALDRRSPRRWRIAGVVATVSMSVGAVGSGSKACWVGLTAAGVATVVAHRQRIDRRVVGALVLAAIAAIAPNAPRLADLVDRDAPISSRLDEWTLATRVVADRPLIGVGPEGYRIAAAAHIDAGYERAYGREVMPDRAHSAPLDVAATIGVPGALVWCVLVAAVLRAACRRQRTGDAMRAGIAAAVIAYQTQALFLFPLFELDPVLWLFAGIVVGGEPAPASPGRWHRPAAVGAFAAAGVFFVTGILGVAADRIAGRAIDLSPEAAASELERAIDLRPDVLRLRLVLAAADDATGTLAGVDRALEAAADARRLSPGDPLARREEARLYSHRAEITGVDDDVDAAVAAWRDVVALEPNCAPCERGLGLALALADDVDGAIDALARAVALAPDDATSAELLGRLREIAGS